MKRTGYLINAASGPIGEDAALTQALARKQIAGARLDVFDYEPKVGKDLRALKDVVLTPHLGSAMVEFREDMASVVDNILAFLAGKTPPNCVNPEVLRCRGR
jgi:glyoxylate reductase